MATVTFILKDSQLKSETPILSILRFDKERVKFSTGLKINPIHWNKDKRRAKQTNKFPSYPEFNQRLDQIKSELEEMFLTILNSGQIPSKELIKSTYNELKNPKSKLSLNEFIPVYIKELESGQILAIKKKGGTKFKEIYKHSTIKNFKGFEVQFNEFQNKLKIKLDYNDITDSLNEKFIQFFVDKDYKPNTIGRHIKHLKSIIRYTHEVKKWHNNDAYRKFEIYKTDVKNVVLTIEELDKLYFLDLSENQHYEVARDVFLVGCYTAQRFSDYTRISKDHIKTNKGQKVIDIITQKTKEQVIIPLQPIIEEILNKYNGYLPKVYEQKVNKYIKEVCKIAEINDPIEVEEIKGGIPFRLNRSKYLLVKTHTARRTGATIMYSEFEIPTIKLMKITGHKTESNLLKYICIEKNDNAYDLSKNSFYTRKPIQTKVVNM
jgi:integrase